MAITSGTLKSSSITAAATSADVGTAPDQRRLYDFGDRVAELSPEGPHQDGFDAVGIFSINRSNVCGGELLVFDDKDSHPFWTILLKPGDVVVFNDREVWHDGNRITKDVEGIELNYMDVFVFTARRD